MVINPSTVYWMNVLCHVREIVQVLMISSAIFCTISLICGWIIDDEQEKAWCRTFACIMAIICLVMIFLYIFIPDKQTLAEIMLAKHIRVDETGWTPKLVRETADYVVKAFKQIK